jgi:hypothetical protein
MDTPSWVRNGAEWEDLCRQIVAASTAVIRAQVSLTEGARLLAALSHEVRADDDPGFLTFIGIASETDRFPDSLALTWLRQLFQTRTRSVSKSSHGSLRTHSEQLGSCSPSTVVPNKPLQPIAGRGGRSENGRRGTPGPRD